MSARSRAFEVLVVEDDFLVCADLSSHMRDAGYVVSEAASGDEAIAELGHGRHFDAVVTDISLGSGADGWDVAACARRLLPSVAVIYVSGNSRDAARAVEHSVFLAKPYDNRAVERACNELCGKKS